LKKKTHKLKFNPEYDFFLIGISSHENDYRISWALNNYLGLKLVRMDDHKIIDNNHPEPLRFSIFSFDDDESLLSYKLIANRCQNGFLIGEIKNIDFLFIISGETNQIFLDNITQKINNLTIVNTAFQIDPEKLRSRQKLLF